MQQPTVLVDQYRNAAKTQVIGASYKGLRIHALPGLHEFVASQAVAYFPSGIRFIDLAAGSGAMCCRMQDLGYQPTGVDYVDENFQAESVPFIQADLNGGFSSLFETPYQGIIASEIIEHLENPRHFARECHRLLVPGGRLILTTPNVESPGSKATFLRTGQFLWFSEKDYATEGHMTPLTQWQIRKCFSEAGFDFLWSGSFGDSGRQIEGSPRLQLLSRIIARLSSTPKALAGEIFVAVLEKPQTAAT